MLKSVENTSITKGNSKNKYGQYFTPNIVADFMISLADISKKSAILEPSCGEGIFLKLLQEKGYDKVTAYEIDPQLATDFNFVKYESFISADIQKEYDLIIGNPPYIRWKNLEKELKEELATNYLWNKYFNSLCDYLYIFILKSIEVLKENGQLIFICPEYWMNTTHALGLRNYMAKNGYFEKIYHFNETPIFSNAAVSIVVFKYVKSKNKSSNIEVVKYYKNKVITLEVLNELQNPSSTSNEIERFQAAHFEVNKRWLLTNKEVSDTISEFEKKCANNNRKPIDLFGNSQETDYHTIGTICDIGNGMVSGLDKTFQLNGEVLNVNEKKHSINVIKAKNLSPFTYNDITKYIFANSIQEESELKENYPSFYNKLKPVQEKLDKRYQYGRKINFWEWVFLRNYNLFNAAKPRIFVPCKERISNKEYFRFSYVESGIFPTQDVTALFLKDDVKESIYYILAFLNNYRVFNWLKNKGIVKGNIVEFSEKPISSIPFRKINWTDAFEVKIHQQISALTIKYIEEKDTVIINEINELFNKLLR